MKSIGMGMLAVSTVLSTALALHYQGQVRRLQQERAAVTVTAEPVRQAPVVAPVPPPPVERVIVRTVTNEVQVHTPAPEAAPARGRAPAERRGTNWMESFRTSDPERYEAFQQARRDILQSIQSNWQQKTNFLMNRDTSRLTEAEYAEYSFMLRMLNDTWTLGQRLQQMDLPHEERWQVMSAVRSNMTVLTPLLENERDRELRDLALGMGHTEQEAAAFVTHANTIVSNTSTRSLFPGMMRGRGMGFFGPRPDTRQDPGRP